MNSVLLFCFLGLILLFIYEYLIYKIIIKRLDYYFKKTTYSIEEYLYNVLKDNSLAVSYPEYVENFVTYNHLDDEL